MSESSRSEWHCLTTSEVLSRLDTDYERGLAGTEARTRLAQHGTNALTDRGTKSPWLILREQLTSVMVIILIAAGGVSIVLTEYTDAAAIFAIVILNAVLGFVQEYRAEKAMVALRRLADPVARVRRDGRVVEIPARDLVPGDIVLLEAGSRVPADGRLVEAANLRTQESALTGESEPIDKQTGALPRADLPLGDRRNMAYTGTAAVAGRGVLVVTETGMRTELGRLADMLQMVRREQTPLQRRLEQLARGLAVAALAVVAVVFGLGVVRGEEFRTMFLVAISLAVAAVPEGLPAVVTIALTLGARRMLGRKALIRRLAAVETLGSVTVICSDKTGTLTENRMTVTMLDVAGHRLDITDGVRQGRVVLPEEGGTALALLLAGGALCNDAVLEADEHQAGRFKAVGDPTEGALVIAAAEAGFRRPELESSLPRAAEIPFSSERKRMSTVHSVVRAGLHPTLRAIVGQASHVMFTKGAVDALVTIADRVWEDGRTERLGEARRARITAANADLAQSGMRVLGLAFRTFEEPPRQSEEASLETGLIFVGMSAMVDPVRPEVKEAVATCRTAGVRPLMITGDHPLTARKVALELGIAQDQPVVSGVELAGMSGLELADAVEKASVYARVAPEHKLSIVETLQQKGHIVAMTGDGVNDAPALKKADIGVAMGIAGTDVAKEASDMVLLDDNFATIVAAVREGRAIYDNIRKFIKYILSANAGEIWVMLIAPFLGMPLPLLPLQILWVNLVTDGLPSLALSIEPAERDVMRRPPRSPKENIFGQGLGWYIVWVGLMMGVTSLGMGFWAWRSGDPGWRTMVFTTVTMSQLFQSLAVRSRDSAFRIGFHSNPAMLVTFLLTLTLQMAVIYVPFLQSVFQTVPLSVRDLSISLLLSSSLFWAVELDKLTLRVRDRRSKTPGS